jgi:hypothetical protein
MNKMLVISAVTVAALVAGIAVSAWRPQLGPTIVWRPLPAPVIVATVAPPLPTPKPAVRVKAARKLVAKVAKIDCDQVRLAKQYITADEFKALAVSHPEQAKAARACQ